MNSRAWSLLSGITNLSVLTIAIDRAKTLRVWWYGHETRSLKELFEGCTKLAAASKNADAGIAECVKQIANSFLARQADFQQRKALAESEVKSGGRFTKHRISL